MEQVALDNSRWRMIFSLPVIVAALGYFVDIYDLVLFSIDRVPSLNPAPDSARLTPPKRVTQTSALSRTARSPRMQLRTYF